MRSLTLISLLPLGMSLANPVLELAKRNPASVTYTVGTLNVQNAAPAFLSLDQNIGFYFQGDGNFVTYRGTPNAANALWNSATGGNDCVHNPCSLNFQGDGNLVVYINNQPKWASNTAGHTSALLVFQDIAPYIAIYNSDRSKKLWSTPPPPTQPPSNPCNPARVKREETGVEMEERAATLCP